ncbi:hypothetical protein VNO80_25468 [Phaseolus coccineus]|uniref:Uncharacterized protein n=1 Tax=Phaseolus coccineus TaxID=3886 RepID=A0AAN9QTE1_PHACN
MWQREVNVRTGVRLTLPSSPPTNPTLILVTHLFRTHGLLMLSDADGYPQFPDKLQNFFFVAGFSKVVQLGLGGVLKERADFEYGFLLDGREYEYKKLGRESGEITIRIAKGESSEEVHVLGEIGI